MLGHRSSQKLKLEKIIVEYLSGCEIFNMKQKLYFSSEIKI
jgi:hypothetical protein